MNRLAGRLLLITAAFALLLVLVPAIAIGAGNFDDVPASHTFKADIDWLAAAGVTKGCNPPANTRFCPDDYVTRGQMAAFMHRLAINQVVDAKTAIDADKLGGYSVEHMSVRAGSRTFHRDCTDPIPDSGTILATVTIDAPDVGFIIANAGGDTWSGNGSQLCQIWINGYPQQGGSGWVDHAEDYEADCWASIGTTVGPGTKKVELFFAGDAAYDGTLWAMWIPFDGGGAMPVSVPTGDLATEYRD